MFSVLLSLILAIMKTLFNSVCISTGISSWDRLTSHTNRSVDAVTQYFHQNYHVTAHFRTIRQLTITLTIHIIIDIGHYTGISGVRLVV